MGVSMWVLVHCLVLGFGVEVVWCVACKETLWEKYLKVSIGRDETTLCGWRLAIEHGFCVGRRPFGKCDCGVLVSFGDGGHGGLIVPL